MSEVNWNNAQDYSGYYWQSFNQVHGFFWVFNHFLKDWKIEELQKFENSTETLRKDLFYRLVVYDPVGFTGINKIHQESTDFNWK